jgi:hypothetical protein
MEFTLVEAVVRGDVTRSSRASSGEEPQAGCATSAMVGDKSTGWEGLWCVQEARVWLVERFW